MQDKPKIKSVPTKQFLTYASKMKTWLPVVRNGWMLKFSSYRDTAILLIVVSTYTKQTVIRYFGNEDEACNFINYIIELDPQEQYDF